MSSIPNSNPTILILGAGPGVGLAVAKKFAAEGWNVAAVGRNPSDEVKHVAKLTLSVDFADLTGGAIEGVFGDVEREFGAPPDVVVYNAYSLSFAPTGTDPFTVPISSFAKDLAVNTTSVYASLFHAIKGFRSLASHPTTTTTTTTTTSATQNSKRPRPNGVFIYTGNMMNTLIVPETFSLGAGKNATAYLIETAAATYGAGPLTATPTESDNGTDSAKIQTTTSEAAPPLAHFYYADQRLPNGASVMAGIDGDAHADAFWELANGTQSRGQGPWDWTFVKGKGYKRFEAKGAGDREVRGVGQLMREAGGGG